MRKKKSPKHSNKNRFSLATLISAISLSLGVGYNAAYFYAAHYELPTLIHEKSQELAVCFSPNPLCQQTLLTTLKMAKHSIHLQAYSFTDRDIADALIDAKKRGVEVQVILDKSNKTDKHSKANLLAQNGIKVYIDSPQGIAHSKVLILEKETVITGSYNFSAAAYSRNAENLLIIKNTELTQRYLKNWEARKALSTPFRRQKADAIFLDKGVIAANAPL
ncbi:phospholipase D family protein [Candidatus Odyssella thessalonicensis]|uniref:phospholipase D family nuclease n=1 Tax=Candidatus Odyssella thessalonicensis TaxID=84647 RepID=UPI000225B75A|nr:phospholipase D family protein [Candidatus Odyssella thessalonicensis]